MAASTVTFHRGNNVSLFRQLWRVGRGSLLYLCDSHTWTKTPDPVGVQMWRTLRYRCVSSGLPLTGNDRRLLSFRNRHAGQRAFVIGNGPSLNKCDLRKLKSEITFGVNSIFLNEEKMGFRPSYYVVEDIFVAEDRAREIKPYQGPVKFFGNYLRYCLGGAVDAIWLNVWVNYDDYDDFPHFSEKASRGVWVGGTVSYICLQLAYYMGFRQVYLVGFDHNYVIPHDAVVTNHDDDIRSTSDDPNHFDPRYFGKGYRWHDPHVERMDRALRKARKHFEADGRAIHNATVGGKLEVFPRVEYGSLF